MIAPPKVVNVHGKPIYTSPFANCPLHDASSTAFSTLRWNLAITANWL